MGSFPETKNDPNFSSVDCSEGGGGIRVAKEGGGGIAITHHADHGKIE